MLHLPSLIIDLALILGAAAVVTLIFKKLKQPVVLGYIIAGILVGPNFKLFPTIIEVKSIQTWADIGVLFLLFGLGLEFSFKKLLKVGGVAFITAITEVILTLLTGFGVGKLLGWNNMNSLFLGGMLAIASTTIIIRAFDELGVKNQKFAGIVTGVLVIEDLVVVLLMVILSTVAVGKSFSGTETLFSVLKLVFFLILWFVAGIFFLPTLLQKIRNLLTEETLLIVSLALCFLMVLLATYAGFSPALGAFIMGSILAETTRAEKIEQITKSVKNLFGAIFFVSVGMLLDMHALAENIFPVICATLVLLLGKPLFVATGAVISGQPLKTAIQSGMSLSQIGEFSFILASLGLSLGVTGNFLYPVAIAVSVITTFFTPFMIRLSEPFYNFLNKVIPQPWLNSIDKYSISTQNISEISDWKKILRSTLVNSIIFSVIILTIILLSTKYIEPLFYEYKYSRVITAAITLIILSPFLWGLSFRRTQREAYSNVWMKTTRRAPLMVLLTSRVALALFFIGMLFNQLFSPLIAFSGVLISIIILFIFSKRIKHFYTKIEDRFLKNYNEREIKSKDANAILTPWDTHITDFDITADSPLVGKSLAELKIRENYGVNIVAILRGEITINIPERACILFPYDKISVIGTDEQLRRFRVYIESITDISQPKKLKSNVSLHHFTVSETSTILGKSIRNSGIRESNKALVVGVERNGKRIINPESDFIFALNDKVWIVGNDLRLKVSMAGLTGEKE
jgi:CPA2 family monovalent cation:H+ antiporter-2